MISKNFSPPTLRLINYLTRHKITHLYHATYRPVLKSIKKLGLGACPPQRIDAWPGFSHRQFVYLAPTSDLAGGFADAADNPLLPTLWRWQVIILQVKISDLDLNYLSFDKNNSATEPSLTFQYQGIIPWSKIKKVPR